MQELVEGAGAVVWGPLTMAFDAAVPGLGKLAVPNLIAILLLSPLVVRLSRDYFLRRTAEAAL
ncbi:hypothetical protein KFJ24_16025 [Marinobacter sediminum]|uniref:hypothetical protein n=1 Tax=Marinobacter sediminum TaxID=256323 RepID=UPI0020306E68|nr:hypothetical protein [Marinobacter sediminum]MCM0613995.1 hypothetical protein [Marinobacter sediminum]